MGAPRRWVLVGLAAAWPATTLGATAAAPSTANLDALFAAAPGSSYRAAAPFRLIADATARARAKDCLAQAVYYEAANQPLQGRQAVAQVVLNRLRHPAYPKSVCAVVYQGAPLRGCQFTFACDGALARAPRGEGWRSAREVAEQALDGGVEPSVGASTHYHTLAVHPLWSLTMQPTQRIGDHQFYRFQGALGEVAALVGRYAGVEPQAAGLQIAEATTPRRSPAWSAPGSVAFAVWGLPLAKLTARGGVILVAVNPASSFVGGVASAGAQAPLEP